MRQKGCETFRVAGAPSEKGPECNGLINYNVYWKEFQCPLFRSKTKFQSTIIKINKFKLN